MKTTSPYNESNEKSPNSVYSFTHDKLGVDDLADDLPVGDSDNKSVLGGRVLDHFHQSPDHIIPSPS